MKNIIRFTVILFLCISTLKAQETSAKLYEGKMNDKMPITLFLQAEGNECNFDLDYSGMYKYDGVSEWLQLDVTTNGDGQFAFVEYGFTGVLILQETAEGFDGIWISPDGKRQLKIALKVVELPDEKKEEYLYEYEEVNYANNDC